MDSGSSIVMGEGHFLQVIGGTLRALGTATNPARIVGSTAVRGHWGGLMISQQSDSSILRHLEIRHGGRPIGAYANLTLGSLPDGLPIVLDTVLLAESGYDGLVNLGNAPVRIRGLSAVDNDSIGVRIAAPSVFATSITGSRLERNSAAGIAVLFGAGHAVTGSIIASNTFGVRNTTGNSFDAVNNWWGTPTGPLHPTLNPTGTGNAVSDNVLFNPWLLLLPNVP
jgi:hypothetical protein